METKCSRCGAGMSCDAAGECWCKELPRGPMPKMDVVMVQERQDGTDSGGDGRARLAVPLPEATTGGLCRACLEHDLRALGLLK